MANSLGEIANNETLTVEVTVYDDDTGTVRDLSNFEAVTFVIHDHQNHSNLITVTDTDGIDTTNAATGILVIEVSADLMSDLDAREYGWELHLTFDDGTSSNAGQGTISVFEGLV